MTKYIALQNKIQAHLDRPSGLSAQVRSELTRCFLDLEHHGSSPNVHMYAAYAHGILFALENPANR